MVSEVSKDTVSASSEAVERLEALDWTEAAEKLATAVEGRIAATARKAAESLYEGLLYDTQDYLRENTLFNLDAELKDARAAEARAREALARVAKAAGLSVENYYDDTSDKIIRLIERQQSTLRSQAKALENMDHALEECRAFIDRYSDVRDGDYGGVEPNEAMQLVHAIDQSRAALTPEVKS